MTARSPAVSPVFPTVASPDVASSVAESCGAGLAWPADSTRAAHWPGGELAAVALAISQHLAAGQSALIVAESAQAAQQLQDALAFFAPAEGPPLLRFPAYETLAYDLFSPSEALLSVRLRGLYELRSGQPRVCLADVGTLMQRLPPPEFVSGNSLLVRTGDRFAADTQRRQLVAAGYRQVETVGAHGEFAVRGSLLDLFPMGQTLPLRIDLFDEQVESIRRFDPETQLTVEKTAAVEILPGREFGLTAEEINRFQNGWHQRFGGDPLRCAAYRAVSDGRAAAGVEAYLPLFHERMASLFDYLPADCVVFVAAGAHAAAEAHWGDIQARYEQLGGDLERPLLPPAELYLPADALFGAVKGYRRVIWGKAAGGLSKPLPELILQADRAEPAGGLRRLTERAERTLVVAESAGRRELLVELIGAGVDLPVQAGWRAFLESGERVGICVARIDRGFASADGRLAVVTENELLGERVRQESAASEPRWAAAEQLIRNLTELRPGAAVVHIEHGVGRYRGLEKLEVGGQINEFLYLEYAGGNKLYVPVSALNMIARYSGADGDNAPLHRLGSGQWEKAVRRARAQVRDTAAELLDIHARRAAQAGRAFAIPADYARFCAAFPFEETADQLSTMAAVEADLAAERAMDRLVCGDVGFGKTEIAMRAAFIASTGGAQVLMLVPTTLLARQHYDSFRDRFAGWPQRIDSLSRLRTAAEQQQVLARFAAGEIEVLIGTHKLLGGQLETARVGLLIVDEEHRFGVRQKERLKSLRSEVDILTLTATPIPRTLNMAMAAVRDLSIIATPPAKRLAVQTFVRTYDRGLVREAIEREMQRGGQVYLLHNEVRSIERTAEELRELLPQCHIEVAHGQLRERVLERIIADFYHHRFDVLVCSTIIETGIDIPNANTIVIERADKFGLAQLHQLRGRVGRSHHQAYAYLLTPERQAQTADAIKRLEAIAAADALGSGFALATHDLEIRGAGELLGAAQSGQIHAVGFELYQQLLAEAVRALQAGEGVDLEAVEGIAVDLHVAALIPDDYLPDVNGRLQLYKRIAATETAGELRQLQVEMIDRFGLLPEPVKLLVRQQRIKQLGRRLGISQIDCGERGGRVQFGAATRVEPARLVELVQAAPESYALGQGADGQTLLRIAAESAEAGERFALVERLLERLAA
ncbi:MAG: transcription-repair coupling factor [Cellvibrionales bacterium]|nr:transcription-repair coupling factor [Cellvibrionales bacterium]